MVDQFCLVNKEIYQFSHECRVIIEKKNLLTA